ncbi:MAG: hypothetical protein QOD89_1315 [Bradyrhizobium sp.]|nr:hypothetical protein [Bradyrhizobium sp.]
MAEDRTVQKYFQSWASYEIPMRPVRPITYEDSEELTSYYLAVYDERGNLARFTKFFREVLLKLNFELDQDLAPGTRVYFEATRFARPGQNISFSATEGLDQYFRGVVTTVGRSVELEMISRTIFFSDEYAYWPEGTLRHRIAEKKDGSRIETFFDKSGRQVAPQAVPN